MAMEPAEIFALLGFPMRIVGRIPLFGRYIFAPPRSYLGVSDYALRRYGTSFAVRPWLRVDIDELQKIEQLINEGTDDEVMRFRQAQLRSGATTTVVGSLLAGAGATMLTLDDLAEINITVRGLFILSLMLSLMSVYFTLVQQRELSLPPSARTLRDWLWNGRYRQSHLIRDKEEVEGRPPVKIKESSLTSNILLQAPFELLSIAISIFLVGLAAYLGEAMTKHVKLGTGRIPNTEAFLVAYVICTVFALLVFGQALGQKDREVERCRQLQGGAPPSVVAAPSPISPT